MVNLGSIVIYTLVESVIEITSGISKNVPIIINASISIVSAYNTGRAIINFYYSPNPVAKVFFGANYLCSLIRLRPQAQP